MSTRTVAAGAWYQDAGRPGKPGTDDGARAARGPSPRFVVVVRSIRQLRHEQPEAAAVIITAFFSIVVGEVHQLLLRRPCVEDGYLPGPREIL